MRFAIALPNGVQVAATIQPWERTIGGDEIALAMRRADALGFHKVKLGEHFAIPRNHVPLSGDHYLETTTAMAFVGGVAPRMELASGVSLMVLHHPIVFAKMWATLDWLTGGRAVPMIGVGWLKGEFDMLGVDFHQRGRLCDEYIAAVLELWASDSPSFEGPTVCFHDIGFAPKPVRGTLPLWFGGDADAVLRRVSRWGAGWAPFQTPPEAFPEKLDFIRSQPDYHGRPVALQYSLSRLGMGHGHVPTNNARAIGSWNAQEVLDQIGWMASLGVTEAVMTKPPLDSFDAYLDWLQWIAEEVMPQA